MSKTRRSLTSRWQMARVRATWRSVRRTMTVRFHRSEQDVALLRETQSVNEREEATKTNNKKHGCLERRERRERRPQTTDHFVEQLFFLILFLSHRRVMLVLQATRAFIQSTPELPEMHGDPAPAKDDGMSLAEIVKGTAAGSWNVCDSWSCGANEPWVLGHLQKSGMVFVRNMNTGETS